MIQYISMVFIVAMIATFLIILAKKWRIIEYMEAHGNDFVYKLATCDFCLSFWSGLILSVAVVLVTGNIMYITIPFCSTPISRRML